MGETTAGLVTMTAGRHMTSRYLYVVEEPGASLSGVRAVQICELIQSFNRLLGSAPTCVEAGLPSLNMIRVGIPRTA